MSLSYRILLIIFALCFFSTAKAETAAERAMVAKAKPYFGLLTEAATLVWPDAPSVSVFASQVEKESLWNPRAELCVPKPSCSRERGIGFGQMTITSKFNVFQEVGALHPALKGWAPKDYYDPRLQLIAVVAKDRQHFRQCTPLMANEVESIACMLSSYNGGFGGFSADRRLCSNTKGCKADFWYGHVENTSLKAKVAQPGYGQSFFQINRGYVRTVWIERRVKYASFLDPALRPAPVLPPPPAVVVVDNVGPVKQPTSPIAAILPNEGTPASIPANANPVEVTPPAPPAEEVKAKPSLFGWLSNLFNRN